MRNQDAIFVIVAVASTKVGRDAAWKFFKENHEEIRKKYETGYLLCRLVKVSAFEMLFILLSCLCESLVSKLISFWPTPHLTSPHRST